MRSIAATLARAASAGKPVILLPQAFGPFERPPGRDAALRAVGAARLVFARDEASLGHLRSIGAPMDRVRRAPDFTADLPGRPPARPDEWRDRVAIVPNVMMTTATDGPSAAAYLPFLAAAVAAVREGGLEPIVVLHESTADRALADELAGLAGELRIVAEPDPLALKGILGACRLVVASRFHAIAAALSGGVPVLATGWSHKYQALLAAYDVPDLLLPVDANASAVRERMPPLLDGARRNEVLARIGAAARRMGSEVRGMWSQVRRELGAADAT
jgi:colanic acid/amylovoran biosynthesis protein